LCQGYGHIALDCPNSKSITIFNGEINGISEEEKEDIPEPFEEETMREPISDEEYVDVDFREVFKEEGNKDLIYDDEYDPDDIHEVFKKEEYDEEYLHTEYGESLEVKRILQTTTTIKLHCEEACAEVSLKKMLVLKLVNKLFIKFVIFIASD